MWTFLQFGIYRENLNGLYNYTDDIFLRISVIVRKFNFKRNQIRIFPSTNNFKSKRLLDENQRKHVSLEKENIMIIILEK